jgi:hypothetical protein
MKRGMTFLDRDENAAAGRTNFSARRERSFDRRAIVRKIDNVRREMNKIIGGRRTQKLDRVFRRHCARRVIVARTFHQMICARPIAVTIEQRANYSTAQNAGKRFVFFLRLPIGHDFIAFDEAANVQSGGIRRAATEASVVRRVMFLKRLFRHDDVDLAA